jgi:hypothetical protein
MFLAGHRPLQPISLWRPSFRFSAIDRSAGSVLLSFGLLLAWLTFSRGRFWLGTAAIMLSVACDSVLNLIAVSRGIEAEEALQAAKVKREAIAGLDGLT